MEENYVTWREKVKCVFSRCFLVSTAHGKNWNEVVTLRWASDKLDGKLGNDHHVCQRDIINETFHAAAGIVVQVLWTRRTKRPKHFVTSRWSLDWKLLLETVFERALTNTKAQGSPLITCQTLLWCLILLEDFTALLQVHENKFLSFSWVIGDQWAWKSVE